MHAVLWLAVAAWEVPGCMGHDHRELSGMHLWAFIGHLVCTRAYVQWESILRVLPVATNIVIVTI